MSRFNEILKTRRDAMVTASPVAHLTDDDDVREWVAMGRIAMFFCLWAAMISAVALVISVRF